MGPWSGSGGAVMRQLDRLRCGGVGGGVLVLLRFLRSTCFCLLTSGDVRTYVRTYICLGLGGALAYLLLFLF